MQLVPINLQALGQQKNGVNEAAWRIFLLLVKISLPPWTSSPADPKHNSCSAFVPWNSNFFSRVPLSQYKYVHVPLGTANIYTYFRGTGHLNNNAVDTSILVAAAFLI
jgi:hypothetical protein